MMRGAKRTEPLPAADGGPETAGEQGSGSGDAREETRGDGEDGESQRGGGRGEMAGEGENGETGLAPGMEEVLLSLRSEDLDRLREIVSDAALGAESRDGGGERRGERRGQRVEGR